MVWFLEKETRRRRASTDFAILVVVYITTSFRSFCAPSSLTLRLGLLELHRKHRNVTTDEHDRGRGDAEDQFAVLQPAHVVHVLGVNVSLRA